MIIINKKISDQEDILSITYDRLKKKSYMKGVKLPDKLNIVELRQMVEAIKSKNDRKKGRKLFGKILKAAKKKKAIEIEKEKLVKAKNKITRAFVTFRTIQIKNFYVQAFQSSSW